MASAVGKALKGLGKAFLKRRATIGGLKAASRRGTPTKAGLAGLVARRAALRGETTAPKGVKAPPKTSAKSFARGAVSGSALTYMLTDTLKNKAIKKEAKAKETKEKLKKSTEEHKKKTKEKRKKYGKHHG